MADLGDVATAVARRLEPGCRRDRRVEAVDAEGVAALHAHHDDGLALGDRFERQKRSVAGEADAVLDGAGAAVDPHEVPSAYQHAFVVAFMVLEGCTRCGDWHGGHWHGGHWR